MEEFDFIATILTANDYIITIKAKTQAEAFTEAMKTKTWTLNTGLDADEIEVVRDVTLIETTSDDDED